MRTSLLLVGGAVPAQLYALVPTFAIALAGVSYLSDLIACGITSSRTVRHRDLASGSTPVLVSAEDRQYVVMSRRQLVLVLQILVGSLVTFGGTAYVVFALNSRGTAFGLGHLSVGVVGLFLGIFAASRKRLPRDALLGINLVTIAYSVVSDGAAGVLTLLPTGAFHDSVIGTVVAVIMSSAIVYLLARR